jgi:hypothetical protein
LLLRPLAPLRRSSPALLRLRFDLLAFRLSRGLLQLDRLLLSSCLTTALALSRGHPAPCRQGYLLHLHRQGHLTLELLASARGRGRLSLGALELLPLALLRVRRLRYAHQSRAYLPPSVHARHLVLGDRGGRRGLSVPLLIGHDSGPPGGLLACSLGEVVGDLLLLLLAPGGGSCRAAVALGFGLGRLLLGS